jgi:RNA polymerase sigma-70 factor (ECF subfamily)
VSPEREKELVSALRDGDTRAFDALYDAYRPRLFGFLVRLTRRRDLAEDLLQETWLRLARSAPALEPDTRIGAWLFTVARNLFVSYRRWAVLDIDRLSELALFPRLDPEAESPLEAACASELERALERGLAALPLVDREVLLLSCVEQMPMAEAAAVLGIAPEAVRKRLSRARARLAELLHNDTVTA